MTTLGAVAQVFNGRTPSKSEQRDSGHPVLKIRDVDATGQFRGNFGSFVDESLASTFRTKQAREGDTLILNAGHSSDVVGSKFYCAQREVAGALVTGEWLIARPLVDVADSRYLFHFLQSPLKRLEIKNMVNGSHLYPRDLARLSLNLPPLPEQRRIASILDQADRLRDMNRRAASTGRDLDQEAFRTRFSRASRVSGTVVDILADVPNAIRTGPFGSQLLHSEFVDEGVAVLGIDSTLDNEFHDSGVRFITEEKYEKLRRYTVRPGDVLVTIMGTVGRTAVVPESIGPSINTKHLCCITTEKKICLPEYLQYYFLYHPIARDYLSRTSKGSIMDGLNMGLIKSLPIVLPTLIEQERFVSILTANKALTEVQKRRAELADELFASLQHRAFNGEL